MKRELLTMLVAVLATAAAASPAVADRGDQVLVILNRTRADLLELYTRPAQAQDWGVDQLGTQRIAAGGKVTVTFGSAGKPLPGCDYELMMVFADGERVVRRADICDIRMMTVTEKNEGPLPSA